MASGDDTNDAALPPDIVRALLGAMTSDGVPAPRPQLLAQIQARIAADAQRVNVTVRAAEIAWATLCKGVEAKTLYQDAFSRTWLARLAPGAVIPAHPHRGDEECVVLEGSVVLDDMELGPSDFQMARAGTRHESVSTLTGCMLLIRTRLHPGG